MNKLKFSIFFGLLALALTTNAQVKKTAVKKPVKKTTTVKKMTQPTKTATVKLLGTRLRMVTDSGTMVIRLYDETPQHRDNFIKLADQHFFDSLLFHRVISGFMIQGGDPLSKNAEPGKPLGMGDVGYTIPAEFNSKLIHKKGALAAARTQNPEKASSGCQFYIVQGKKYSDGELDVQRIKYTEEQRNIYKTVGGVPFLDMDYTVFGEVESGLEVIDKIASAQGDGYNRPFTDIHIKKVEVIK
ncbi:MAG TPA: peptidylprolyl isomerase [Ferruginibacter sp.]|nr:peptidylprolyl isomerase [Ferruginibacter sp.]